VVIRLQGEIVSQEQISLREALDAGLIHVGDGAMGTSLQDAGLDDGGAPELWNIEKTEAVAAILREYAQAGCSAPDHKHFRCHPAASCYARPGRSPYRAEYSSRTTRA